MQKTARMRGHGYPLQPEDIVILSRRGNPVGPVFIGSARYDDAYRWALRNGFTRVVWDDSGGIYKMEGK